MRPFAIKPNCDIDNDFLMYSEAKAQALLSYHVDIDLGHMEKGTLGAGSEGLTGSKATTVRVYTALIFL